MLLGLLVASLLTASAAPAANAPARAQPPSASAAGAPPHLLNIVLVKLKRGAAGTYCLLEASTVRAYERARAKVYWLGLQASKDANDVLYLNLHDSLESAERTAALYGDAIKQHPELVKLQQRLDELMISQTSMLTTRRDDVDQAVGRPDFAAMRALRLTIFQVKPGHEGDFITAVRTTNAKDRLWLVYEANETSTFVLISPMRTSRADRSEGPAIPRTLRRFRSTYTRADTRVYTVRPNMSHVPLTFSAANPQFWRPVSAGLH